VFLPTKNTMLLAYHLESSIWKTVGLSTPMLMMAVFLKGLWRRDAAIAF
jgi:hypothetical protein